MALSEDDRRRLDEIERALTADDPTFATRITTIDAARRRAVLYAGLALLVGAVVLVVGLVAADSALVVGVIVSALGALLILGSMFLFVRQLRGSRVPE